MRIARSTRPKEATFDLTPMIDVVMLLIVFFTMTSTFSRSEQKPLDLPTERGTPPSTDEHRLAIYIDVDTDGTITILGEPVDIASLGAALQRTPPPSSSGDAAEIDVVVRADRTCPSLHVNRIAAELLKSGVRRWKLATAPDGTVPAGGTGVSGGGVDNP